MEGKTANRKIVQSVFGHIGQLPLLRPLSERNFRLLWLGESISVFGGQFGGIALTWVTLQVTGSGLALGTVLMAAAIPNAVFMLFGGVLSDRFSPRWLMLVSNVSRCIIVAVLALLVFLEAIELWHLYVLAVLYGLLGAFFSPALMTLIPQLVSRDRLEAGNSLVQGTMQLSSLTGAAPAGFLISAFGVAVAFGVDAISFAVAAMMLWLIKQVNRQPVPSTVDEVKPARRFRLGDTLADIRSGLRVVWGTPAFKVLIPAIAVVNFCFSGPLSVGLASMAYSRFTGGAASLGIVMAVAGGAALLGSLLAGSIRLRHRGLLLLGIYAVRGAGMIVLGSAQDVVTASLLVAAVSLTGGLANIMIIAWIQATAQPAMLGRVMGLMLFASVGLQPLSYAVAGSLVDMNTGVMFTASGILILVTGLYLAANRVIRTLD